MNIISRRLALLLVVLLTASTAVGDWFDVWQADEQLDLVAARTLALDTIAQDPTGAEAVAAAMWWLANLENLPDPEEVLTMTRADRDPELGLVLARIEAVLSFEAPAGSLAPSEFAGPFGVFSYLDLERSVVPPDGELPPPGTVWRDEATPYRVSLRTRDAFVGPPSSMVADGVYLVAWTIRASEETTGWLVVEARGGYNLEIDGRDIDERRECGVVDPATNWYSIRLGRGLHRLRLEVASPEGAEVRASLVDERGAPLAGVSVIEGDAEIPAPSEVESTLPPASRGLESEIGESGASVPALHLAARLAAGRGDRATEIDLLEQALVVDPEDPWTAFALAKSLFLENGGAATGDRARRITRLLRIAASIPGSQLLERALAVREGRGEDSERILDDLVDDHGDDVRVLRIKVREAVRRGWAREGEEELERLEAALPGSHAVTGLRLDVLSALERWDERETLLRALAAATPIETRWIGELASSCLVSDAVAATEGLQSSVEDPDFDIQLIRLYLEAGDLESARTKPRKLHIKIIF